MNNYEVARVFFRIADMLEIKGDNPFKIRAYRKAAEAVYHLDEDLRILKEQNRISQIPGIGKAVEDKINQLLDQGRLDYYEKLQGEVPPGVVDMTLVPGLGPRTAALIYRNLGIDNLDDLLKAAHTHQLRHLPGIGPRIEENIIRGLEMLKKGRGKTTLGEALPLGEHLCQYLLQSGQVLRAQPVGSVRRGKPLVSDLDLLVATSDADARVLLDIVKGYPGLRVDHAEEQVIQGIILDRIPFEIIVVEEEEYWAALWWTTGSKEHRQAALGDRDRDFLRGSESEAEVYKRLGLPFIPREIRENRGEIEKAREGRLPNLVSREDIKGDLHVHSNWSDGLDRIQDIALAARSLGYEYIAITDHSRSLPISGGLNEDRLAAQGAVIDAVNQEQNIVVLKGIEVDILKDGELDFSDEVLEKLDVVVASIHSHFKLEPEKQTERLVAAMKNPHVNIIGHLTGRLLNRRSGYGLDLDQVIATAAKTGTALEINSHPDRLDIDEEIARQARDAGASIAINSDAHHRNDLQMIRYGVTSARRAWLESQDVINTWSLKDLRQRL
mgnify:CR=1 FL=1